MDLLEWLTDVHAQNDTAACTALDATINGMHTARLYKQHMCALRNFVLKENCSTKCNRKQGLGVGLGFGVALAGPLAPRATPKPPCVPNLNHLCKNDVPLVAQKMSFGPLVLPRANPKPVRSFLRCSQAQETWLNTCDHCPRTKITQKRASE